MNDAEGGAPFYGSAVLVYGGAKGIGRAAALEFARRGARVAVADLDIASAMQSADAIQAAGGQSVAVACDVLSSTSVAEAADKASSALGEIDIVMNNVGGILSGNPEDIPLSEWERMLSLNLMSAVRSNAVFLPKMLARRRGHIINTASFAGLYPYATNRMPYVAAKAGLIALSESLALYLHPQGIRVSCLCPGPVATGVAENIKTWTPNLPFRGPGASLVVKTAEQVAITLADGVRDGRIIIPSHEEAWETLREHAAGPDQFIARSIDRFANGDSGLPSVDPTMLAAFGTQQGKVES